MAAEDRPNTRFVQYFLVSGLDVNFGLEPDDANLSLELYAGDNSPLERSYKPRILRHYPDMTGWSHFNPEALSRLCLPQGLRFTNDRARYPPAWHPFLLTKEDGSKSCGFSFVYLEEVKDMNVCHALHTLQKMHSTEMGEAGSTLKKNERTSMRPSSLTRPATSARSRSLPRHYTTRLSGSNLDITGGASYDYRKDTLYATRSLALVCSLPFANTAGQVLSAIHKFINKSDFDIQVLVSFIYNLLYDIPLPSPGRSVRFWCLGDVAAISLPRPPQELELHDYPLLEFLGVLGLENVVKLLTCVLLEHQILVFSADPRKLMLVCESVLCLLYPFQWPHVYVPILPPMLENFLDAPVPYIMGLLRRTTDMNVYCRGSVCIVDIERGELELPEELPYFPYEKELEEELRNTILKYGGKEGAALLKSQATEQLELLNENQNKGSLDDTMDRLSQMIQQFENISTSAKPAGNQHEDKLVLNAAVREVFVNRFVHMFLSFEHFVIPPTEEEEEMQQQDTSAFTNTSTLNEAQQNFDKVSFLSEQVQSHFPFLSSFLETQMFSSFVDEHIQSMSGGMFPETPFYQRLSNLKARFGESVVRTPSYEPCTDQQAAVDLLHRRLAKVELTVSPQKSTRRCGSPGERQRVPGEFPLLDPALLEQRLTDNGNTSSTAVFIRGDRRSRVLDLNLVASQKIAMLSPSQASIAQTNWKFVSQLLKESKQKTKRILLEKLGLEAVEWGHGQIGVTGTEENLLVGSLCDLLERIWAHGLQTRHRKSAFWAFLCKYVHHQDHLQKLQQGSLGQQACCISFISSKPFLLPDHARPVQVTCLPNRGEGNGYSGDANILAIMQNAATIHEIRTELGYSRAWIRLALEQKQLAGHLASMLKDLPLLRSHYKRYAFLRCEEEREQALYYFQTLNAVDFSCFTNAYFNSHILYQVLIFPSAKSSNSLSSANVWLHVVGSHAETDYLHVPRGVIHFSFWARNLGLLTSLRIGHDNAGLTPQWLVEHVLIRNEFTGACFKFPCGRWLGRSVDDGSLERYLVATPVPGVPGPDQMRELVRECAGPPGVTSPPLPLRSTGPVPDDVEIQTMLGEAINRLIKHHHKSLKERVSWAQLMCGETGLVHALILVFSLGFKSARLFGRNLTIWDFFLKVTFDFNQSQSMGGGSGVNSPQGTPVKRVGGQEGRSSTVPRTTQLRRMYTKLITRIETTCCRLGKDDKFQLFVCLAVHDKLLQRIVADLTRAVAAIQLYDETSFLRNPTLAGYLTHVLDAMTPIEVPVDPAIKKSLEQQ